MVFSAGEWRERDFGAVFPPKKYKLPDGTIYEQPLSWELLDPRTVEMKNIGPAEVREIIKRGIHLSWQSADERARPPSQSDSSPESVSGEEALLHDIP